MSTPAAMLAEIVEGDIRENGRPGPLAAARVDNPLHVVAIRAEHARRATEDRVVCTACHTEHSALASFPGTVCLRCWTAMPHPMPTAADVVAAFGGRA